MAYDPNFLRNIMSGLEAIHLQIGQEVQAVNAGKAKEEVRRKFDYLENEFKNIYCATSGLGILESEVKTCGAIASSLSKMGFKKTDCSYGTIGSRLKEGKIRINKIKANRSNGRITVDIELRNTTSQRTYVTIPKGTAFENQSMAEQNVSAGETVTTYIDANATASVSLIGFCINHERSWPSDSSLELTILQSLCTIDAMDSNTIATVNAISTAQGAIWRKIREIRNQLEV
eukprot:212549_1